MKKIILPVLLLLTVGCSFISCSEDAPVADESEVSVLSRDSILIGDQVKWSIRLNLEEGEDAFIEQPDEPVAQGVETIEPFRIDTLKQHGGRMEIEGGMVITAFDSGSFFLPPLIVMIQRTDGSVDTMYYDAPVLEVNTIQVDTASFVPYDIKGQMKYPATFREVFPWVAGALLLAAAVIFAVVVLRNKRNDRSLFGKPKVKDPPHVVALRSLENTRAKKLWQNNKQKQFYTEVTDAMRQYLAGRYGISAMEKTTVEIFSELEKSEVDERLYDKLKDIFTTADFVKFAKFNASDDENAEVIPTAVKFVNSTFVQQMESEENSDRDKESKEA